MSVPDSSDFEDKQYLTFHAYRSDMDEVLQWLFTKMDEHDMKTPSIDISPVKIQSTGGEFGVIFHCHIVAETELAEDHDTHAKTSPPPLG